MFSVNIRPCISQSALKDRDRLLKGDRDAAEMALILLKDSIKKLSIVAHVINHNSMLKHIETTL